MSDRLCKRLMYFCFAAAGILLVQGAAIQQATAPTSRQTLAYRGSGRMTQPAQRSMSMAQ